MLIKLNNNNNNNNEETMLLLIRRVYTPFERRFNDLLITAKSFSSPETSGKFITYLAISILCFILRV
jgi:hypothetical protein